MKEIKWSHLKVGDVVVLNNKKDITYQVKTVVDNSIRLKRLTTTPDGFFPSTLSEDIGFFIWTNKNTVHLVTNSIQPIKRLEPFTF